MEIDSAKRPYPCETSMIISNLNEKYCYEYKDKNGDIKKSNWPKQPLCFRKSTTKNALKNEKGMEVGLDYMMKYLLENPLNNNRAKDVFFSDYIPYPKKYNGHDKDAITKLNALLEEIGEKFKEEMKGIKMNDDVKIKNINFRKTFIKEYAKLFSDSGLTRHIDVSSNKDTSEILYLLSNSLKSLASVIGSQET